MNLHLADTVGGRANESPLTQLGITQAEALAQRLKTSLSGQQLSGLIHSSTAVRAVETAKYALQHIAPDIDIVVSDRLLEIDMGAFSGQPRSQCYTPETLQRIAKDSWNFSPPGGESQRQVEERFSGYIMQQVMPALQAGGPPAIVVAHGMAIKCFLRWMLDSNPGMTVKIRLDNTSITEVAWLENGSRAGWQLLRVNDTAHLQMAGVDAEYLSR